MPDIALLSELEAVNIQLPGGKWAVAAALDISLGAEARAIIPDDPDADSGYRTVMLIADADFYLKFDLTDGDSINTSNDIWLKSETLYVVEIPYDIGKFAADKSCIIHVKQKGSVDTKSVRLVVR